MGFLEAFIFFDNTTFYYSIENDQPLKQNAVHNLIMQNSQANTPSDDELRSLVSTIVSKNEDESDEEFSISTTPLRGNNNNRNDSNQTTTLGSLGLLKKHKANKRRHSEETPVLPTKIPGNFKFISCWNDSLVAKLTRRKNIGLRSFKSLKRCV